MGGKRIEPNGRYEARDHPSIEGLVNVFWHPNEGPSDPRPLLTLGAPAVPLLADALAQYELDHAVPPPRSQANSGLRVVNDDGVL